MPKKKEPGPYAEFGRMLAGVRKPTHFTCKHCGKTFEAVDKRALYCSYKCSKAEYRARRKEKAEAQQGNEQTGEQEV